MTIRLQDLRPWLGLTLAAACCVAGAAGAQGTAAPAAWGEPVPGAMARVLGQTDRLLVVLPAQGDTLAGLAARFLGRADRAFWMGTGTAAPSGQPLIVPLVHPNPVGVQADGVQTVPILSYHLFGDQAAKMVVTPQAFDAQLSALAADGYRVQRLSALRGFLSGQEALPVRSVVITVDGGHMSFYRLAFPVLKKHGVPATLFVASDVVGQPDAVSWAQLQEMVATGLVDVQARGKSQRNLIERTPGDSDLAHRRGLEIEVQAPRRAIEQRLPSVTVAHFAYPFGDANLVVLETLRRNAFELGLTMNPGANAFFNHPLALQRTMVLGDDNLDAFKALLQVRKAMPP
jgi:peptidoglycan/xylan/chitin deacetylase (PgdA/CDA1 family)